ncbi:MAG: hypothetical protein IJE29_04180 [Firmicutes bacterium]|nr:hypothetical protein [Bacillota bacterium]MBQ3199039.1 hypothetical protein [Bacillota bacterium]
MLPQKIDYRMRKIMQEAKFRGKFVIKTKILSFAGCWVLIFAPGEKFCRGVCSKGPAWEI